MVLRTPLIHFIINVVCFISFLCDIQLYQKYINLHANIARSHLPSTAKKFYLENSSETGNDEDMKESWEDLGTLTYSSIFLFYFIFFFQEGSKIHLREKL